MWAATSRRRGDGYKVTGSTVAHVRPRKSGRGCRLPTVKHVSKSSRLGSLVYSCCCRFAAAAAALSLVLRTGKKQQSPHVLVVKDQATKNEIAFFFFFSPQSTFELQQPKESVNEQIVVGPRLGRPKEARANSNARLNNLLSCSRFWPQRAVDETTAALLSAFQFFKRSVPTTYCSVLQGTPLGSAEHSGRTTRLDP